MLKNTSPENPNEQKGESQTRAVYRVFLTLLRQKRRHVSFNVTKRYLPYFALAVGLVIRHFARIGGIHQGGGEKEVR